MQRKKHNGNSRCQKALRLYYDIAGPIFKHRCHRPTTCVDCHVSCSTKHSLRIGIQTEGNTMTTVDTIKSCVLTGIAMLVAYSNTVIAHIFVEPRTAEALVGSATYFNCSTDVTSQAIHWFHYPVGSQTRNSVYGYDKFYNTYQSRFAVEKNETTGVCNLIITSVATGDAGQYECQDSYGGGAKRSAHLVVLVGDPVSQSNVNLDKVIRPNPCGIAHDVVVLTCIAEYIGDDAPILEWKMVGVNKSITDGVTRTTSNGRLLSNLTLQADEKINGSVYTCNTTRTKRASNGCRFGSIKVVGPLADTEMAPCDTDADKCKPLRDAIICILLIVFPIALIGSFVAGWFFRRYWDKRKKEKNDQEEQRASGASALEEIPSSSSEEKLHQDKDLTSDAAAVEDFSANTSGRAY